VVRLLGLRSADEWQFHPRRGQLFEGWGCARGCKWHLHHRPQVLKDLLLGHHPIAMRQEIGEDLKDFAPQRLESAV
jgi:hypothetical protein